MCGYNPFYWYEQKLDNDFIEQKRKDAEMLKDIPVKEFMELVKGFTELELKIVFDLSYEWHDEEMIKAVKQEYKKRGLAWN
jgi:hypothetical protein